MCDAKHKTDFYQYTLNTLWFLPKCISVSIWLLNTCSLLFPEHFTFFKRRNKSCSTHKGHNFYYFSVRLMLAKESYIVTFYLLNFLFLISRAFYLFACRSPELRGICSVAEETHQISKYTSPVLAHTPIFAQTFPQTLSSLQQKPPECKVSSWNFQPSAFQIPDSKVRYYFMSRYFLLALLYFFWFFWITLK